MIVYDKKSGPLGSKYAPESGGTGELLGSSGGPLGVHILASDIASMLRGDNVWSSSYENINNYLANTNQMLKTGTNNLLFDMAKNNAMYRKQLSTDLLSAYEAAYDQKNNILGSNLGQGYKAAGVSDIDDAINSAYESYMINYRENKLANEQTAENAIAKLEEQYVSQLNAISSEQTKLENTIMGEAENFSKFYDTIPSYFEWIFGEAENNDALSELLKTNDWQRYVNENGEFIGSEALSELMYDADGTLNQFGRNTFAKAIYEMSANINVPGYSYADYLKGFDNNFAQWLASESAYDWTPSEGFRNTNMDYALNYLLGLTDTRYVSNTVGEIPPGPGGEIPPDLDDEQYRIYENNFNDNPNRNTSKILIDDSGNTNYYIGSSVGTIGVYYENDSTILAFNNLKIKGNARDVQNDNFTMKFNDIAYKFEMTPDKVKNSRLTSENDIYNEINRHVGGLKENTIYSYNGDLYVAIKSKSSDEIVLRKLQSQGAGGNEESFKKFTNIVNNENLWGNPFKVNDTKIPASNFNNLLRYYNLSNTHRGGR